MRTKAFLASAALALLVPAVATAKPPTAQHARQYRHAYAAARHEFGPAAVGCALIGQRGSCHRRVTDAALVRSLGVLERLLTPVARPVGAVAPIGRAVASTYAPTQVSPYAPVASTSSGGGCGGDTPYPGGGQCWAIPYGIVQCESGGRNVPNAQGSGANGYYQLMVGGTGTRAEQDARASALWNGGRGASNWTCAG